MNHKLLHAISEDEIRQYEEDGVVCIRGQFDQEWVDTMLAASQAYAANDQVPIFKSDLKDDPGQLTSGTYMSWRNDDFMDFVMKSPAAQIAATLMRLDEVRFFYDQLFIKEPGTVAPTAWHNDLPYWPLSGNQVSSVWVACTPVSMKTSGLVYVAGSHKWNKMYKPNPAVPRDGFMLEEAQGFEECPMFHHEFENPDYKFLSWDMEPGDVLVHHPLAVHGSGKNASTTQRRVAISLRYFGGDVVWHGHRTQFSMPPHADGVAFKKDLLPVNDDVFPVAWAS